MKIVAVINTHNRLALLQECIRKVKNQSYPVDKLIVINNGSTDGTEEWLTAQTDIITFTQPNHGGAFGFHRGIEEAYKLAPDWIWIMDDDTIPEENALEALVQKLQQQGLHRNEFGFLSSNVIWIDQSMHNKNRLPFEEKPYALNGTPINNLHLVPSGTFVSLLVSQKAVEKVGLPIKEFFIWYDDVEFTERIVRHGFKGGFVKDSIVLHKTADNLNNNVFSDDIHAHWKYFYGFRNGLYLRKLRKGSGSYYRNVLKHLFAWPFLIFSKRTNNRWRFTKVMWRGTIASLTFRPKHDVFSGIKSGNVVEQSGIN